MEFSLNIDSSSKADRDKTLNNSSSANQIEDFIHPQMDTLLPTPTPSPGVSLSSIPTPTRTPTRTPSPSLNPTVYFNMEAMESHYTRNETCMEKHNILLKLCAVISCCTFMLVIISAGKGLGHMIRS